MSETDRTSVDKWLNEMGLEASKVSVTHVTYLEDAVKSFIAGSSDSFNFMVRQAAPQSHESLGAAERIVRILKEALAALESDFLKQGFAPPKEFFERCEFSEKCGACKAMKDHGSRKGLNHSKSCCRRYESGLKSQVSLNVEEKSEPELEHMVDEALSQGPVGMDDGGGVSISLGSSGGSS